jgi:hypothetical protein
MVSLILILVDDDCYKVSVFSQLFLRLFLIVVHFNILNNHPLLDIFCYSTLLAYFFVLVSSLLEFDEEMLYLASLIVFSVGECTSLCAHPLDWFHIFAFKCYTLLPE